MEDKSLIVQLRKTTSKPGVLSRKVPRFVRRNDLPDFLRGQRKRIVSVETRTYRCSGGCGKFFEDKFLVGGYCPDCRVSSALGSR